MNYRALLLAAGLHALLLLPLLPACDTPTEPPPTETTPPASPPLIVAITPDGTESCPDYYVGFGIWQQQGAIVYVANNGPAAQGGMQVGDYWPDHNQFYPGKHEEGYLARTYVIRQERRHDLLIRIGRICQYTGQ